MKKRILITYASYGSGHKSVAYYLKDYLEKYNNKYEIKIMDFSDYSNIVGKTGEKLFELNFKFRSSAFFTFFYRLFDHDISTIPYKEYAKMLFYKRKLKREISSFNPDICISTHFFTSVIISDFNKKNLINSKIITIITDYKSHKLWIRNQKNENALIVGNEVIKNDLIASGLDKNKIFAYGIPLSDKFNKEYLCDKTSIIKKYKLNDKKVIALFFGGGSMGSSFTYDYFKRIVKDEVNIQLVFIAGKNEKLKEKCEKLVEKYNRSDIKVLGFSTDINNLLNISDLVITKPGGITITECMEMKTPMILIPGNGGQENDNARFLCHKGYAIKCRTPKKLSKVLSKILKNKNILLKMNSNLSRESKNDSVKKIAKLVDKMLKNG